MPALAGGAFVFLAVLILLLVGLIVAMYTRKGLGIDHHPYRNDLPSDDLSGADRTIFTEQMVRAAWRHAHSDDAQAARAAAVKRSRQERRQLQPKQSLRLRIPSPIPPLH